MRGGEPYFRVRRLSGGPGGEGGAVAGAVVDLAGIGGREGCPAVGGGGADRCAGGLDGLHDLPGRAAAAEAAEGRESAGLAAGRPIGRRGGARRRGRTG